MTLVPKTAEETGYDKLSLNKLMVGGEPIGITRSTQLLDIAGEEWTLERWQDAVDRVNSMLIQERWIEDPSKNVKSTDINAGSSSFLSNNVTEILIRTRGKIKRAPFWVRWAYDSVITKESLG
jgi:hypothetical protein